MTEKLDRDWLANFDKALLENYNVDHEVLGIDEESMISWSKDRTPRKTALWYGEKYDLITFDYFTQKESKENARKKNIGKIRIL